MGRSRSDEVFERRADTHFWEQFVSLQPYAARYPYVTHNAHNTQDFFARVGGGGGLEIFRLGCAVVVLQVNFAILCWTEPPNNAPHPRVAILQKLPRLPLSLLLFFSCV